MTGREASDRLLRELESRGLLLLQDRSLPNVVSLVTGEVVRGSWWGHPRSHEIFRRTTELASHPDVLFCKLLAGKVTLVHRGLWPALLTVATSGRAWQKKTLSPEARRLWRRIAAEGSLGASGPAVRELERRLLCLAREEHTQSGTHRMVVETWKSWASRIGVGSLTAYDEATRRIENAATALGASPAALPWHARPTSAISG